MNSSDPPALLKIAEKTKQVRVARLYSFDFVKVMISFQAFYSATVQVF